MRSILRSILGPRVPHIEPGVRRWRYVLPTVLLLLAAGVLLASYWQPYWNMTLHAPQYPKGLHVQAYLNRLEGDVREIDNLNHYIGMRPLDEAAQVERAISLYMTIAMAMLLLGAAAIHTRWAALLVLPALLFPVGFLVDLHLWMNHFGQNLDPTAALSSSVKPFTPPVLGEGWVGNFKTVARVDTGWIMATVASGLILFALFFHRRAYKPLVNAQRRRSTTTTQPRSQHRLESAAPAAPAACRLARAHSHAALLIAPCAAIAVTLLATSPARATDFDIAAAIANAEPGATITVPAGIYAGPVVIDRTVILEGHGRAIIDGDGAGDVVQITAPGVTFRGFTVRNSGSSVDRENAGIRATAAAVIIEDNVIEQCLFGITLNAAPNSVVRNNTVFGKDLHIARRGDGIRLWGSHDSVIENNTVYKTRDVVMWYSDRVQLRANRVTDSRYGLHFMYSHDNVLEDNHLTDNSVGAFLMYSRNLTVRRNVLARNRGPSGYGLGVKDMQGMIVENNLFVGNCVGIYLDNPPVYLPEPDRFTRNVFAYNDIGLAFQPSVRRTAVFENSFIENHQQVAVWGGGQLRDNHFTGTSALRADDSEGHGSESRATRVGNFWSDYRGFDLTGDNIGDIPYLAENLWDNLMDREPNLRLFRFSPAQQAVELAAKAFPVVQPRSLFTDDAPLMQPVRADVTLPPRGSAWTTWLMAAGLLSVAGLALSGAKPQAAGSRGRTPHSGA